MAQRRGLVLIVLGILALYRAYTLHGGPHTLLAVVLGVVALALGAWHMTRKAEGATSFARARRSLRSGRGKGPEARR